MAHRRLGQIVAWLLIIVHLAMISGCTSTSRVTLPGNEIPVGPELKIASAVLKTGEVVDFDGKSGMYVDKQGDSTTNRVIVGTSQGKHVEIDPDEVLEVRFEQSIADGTGNILMGMLLGITISAGVLVIIFMVSYSAN